MRYYPPIFNFHQCSTKLNLVPFISFFVLQFCLFGCFRLQLPLPPHSQPNLSLCSSSLSPQCKSWLTFWLISVGTSGPSSRGLSWSGGSIGPFWDHMVEAVPPSSMFAILVFLVSLASRLS